MFCDDNKQSWHKQEFIKKDLTGQVCVRVCVRLSHICYIKHNKQPKLLSLDTKCTNHKIWYSKS